MVRPKSLQESNGIGSTCRDHMTAPNFYQLYQNTANRSISTAHQNSAIQNHVILHLLNDFNFELVVCFEITNTFFPSRFLPQ